MKKEIVVKAHKSKDKSGKIISVPTYSYYREVKAYSKKGSGKEIENASGNLVIFDDWSEYQDEMNKVGWENQTLMKSRNFKTKRRKEDT